MLRSKVMFILSWPRWFKRLIALIVDAILCTLTTWIAFYLRLGVWVTPFKDQLTSELFARPAVAIIGAIVISIPIFILFGLYRAIFRYSGWSALMAIARAISIYGFIYGAIFTVYGIEGVPRTIGLIQPLLLLFFVGGSRALVSYWFGNSYRDQLLLGRIPKVLIYGAGLAGRELAAAIQNSRKMRVVGFIDDDRALYGSHLNGIKIYPPHKLDVLVPMLEVSDILLAMPSLSRSMRAEIIRDLSKLKVSVRTLPSFHDLANGKINISDIHDLDVEDLLGRSSVSPDLELISKNISGKVIWVTGAGGSIGGELCRQIAYQGPAHLILLEQNEFALYMIEQELCALMHGKAINDFLLTPILASVLNESAIRRAMDLYNPHIIYHAAAYKHVPLVEANPIEGLRNNTIGTMIVALVAMEYGVSNFVLISTDKAVRPTNIMGASKRLAEMILQALASRSSKTCFAIVRFGNVLDSSGSVVPKFREQIKGGGPVTVTDFEMTRFFMTIPEAAQLVIQAGSMAAGGEVFLLDMGEPVKILDLAKRMIELSGLEVRDAGNPNGDIEIKEIGLRPGEKLYEELLIAGNPFPTAHSRIFRAREEFLSWEIISQHMKELEDVFEKNDLERLNKLLKKLVDGYAPHKSSEGL